MPARRRAVWPWVVAVTAAVVCTAVGVVVTAAVVSGTEATPSPAVTAAPPPVSTTPAEARAVMCTTLEREHPAIVAAIDSRNVHTEAPWSDPNKVATTDRLAQLAWATASSLEASMREGLSAESARAGMEYVAGLRALSVSQQDRAPAKQLNGVAMFYNNAADRILAVCGMEG